MSRHENRSTPKVVSGILYTNDAFTGTSVGSPAWFAWLATAATFYYQSRRGGTFTAHREHRQRGGQYWIAYRRRAGLLHRSHLGKPDQLTPDRLEQTALTLST
jgi:LuxR family transcriptional regulator, maltose regulon positive regulatory protein